MSGGRVEVDSDPPLVFRGRLSEDDLVQMWEHRFRLTFGVAPWMPVILLLILIGLTEAALSFGGEPSPSKRAILAVCILAALAAPSLERWSVRRKYRRLERCFYDTQVSIGDEIRIENEQVQAAYQWSAVETVSESPAGILFCAAGRAALFWLPRRLLVTDDYRSEILDLASEHGVRVRRFR